MGKSQQNSSVTLKEKISWIRQLKNLVLKMVNLLQHKMRSWIMLNFIIKIYSKAEIALCSMLILIDC